MLLRFVAQNFLSIADEVELNMFPAPRLRKHPNHVYQTPQVDLLKAAAIYGANGAGKSNIVKAMAYLEQIVTEGDISNPFENNNIKFKLSTEFQNKPTHFEIEFKQKEKYYSYGIDFDEEVIYEEWLYELDIKTEKDELIFERKLIDGKIKLNLHSNYLKTEKDRLRIELYQEEMLEIKKPFSFFLKEKNFDIAGNLRKWFGEIAIASPSSTFNIDSILSNNGALPNESNLYKSSYLTSLNNIIPALDTGVSNILFEKIKLSNFFDEDATKEIKGIISKTTTQDHSIIIMIEHEEEDEDKWIVGKDENNDCWVYIMKTEHQTNEGNKSIFDLEEESDGTNRLFDLVPILDLLINDERVVIIDEIGRSLHPSLLKKLITLIMKTPTKGQIIFTTHDSHLLDLDIFRPDEIWFVEKNKEGRTKAYTMSDFKPRYDENIEKGYLMGRFGAIPYLGDLDRLELELNAETANTH